jgi:molybdopterin synthase catalytic subunit
MRRSSSFHPVAGGSGVEAAASGVAAGAGEEGRVVCGPIDLAGVFAEAHHPGAGAVVLFSGEVRDSNKGRSVAFLEYEAHVGLAEKIIAQILTEAGERWGLTLAVARHRIGRVEIGETAVVVVTASAHRREAYEANRYIIDRIKQEAPIWKCEYYTDGSKEWGNNCSCQQTTGEMPEGAAEVGGVNGLL